MNISDRIAQVVRELTTPESTDAFLCHHADGSPLPSLEVLNEIIGLCRAILFPGYFGHSGISSHTIVYHTGVNVESLYHKLAEQIQAGLCFSEGYESTQSDAETIASRFIERLPHLRRLLATDVVAAYEGDPAATSYGEVISCYPAIRAISNYRIAHELHLLGVPLIPRIITEMAHSETGIDIHPAATIGSHFTIDHGTGVVKVVAKFCHKYSFPFAAFPRDFSRSQNVREDRSCKRCPLHPESGGEST